jgi:hypothetical protein
MVRVHPYGDEFDYERWMAWWGRGKPRFPRDWNPGNGKVVMSLDTDGCDDHRRGEDHGRKDKHGHNTMWVEDGATVLAGYALKLPSGSAASIVSLVGGSVQVDILNRDGRSYTLTLPFANTTYAIPADSTQWLPTSDVEDPIGYQGDAVAGFGGRVIGVTFSAIGKGQPPDGSGAGSAAGPGLVSDTGAPVKVKFHIDGGGRGPAGEWSPSETVTNENPDL